MGRLSVGAQRRNALVDWFYVEQQALCYLGATAKCQRRGRLMVRKRQPRGYDWATSEDPYAGGACTIEHIFPRPLRPSGPHLVLMACHDCNKAKGASPPDPAHVEHALALCLRHCETLTPLRPLPPAQLAAWRASYAAGLRAEAAHGLALLPKPPAR